MNHKLRRFAVFANENRFEVFEEILTRMCIIRPSEKMAKLAHELMNELDSLLDSKDPELQEKLEDILVIY
jgi:hypothetical protein